MGAGAVGAPTLCQGLPPAVSMFFTSCCPCLLCLLPAYRTQASVAQLQSALDAKTAELAGVQAALEAASAGADAQLAQLREQVRWASHSDKASLCWASAVLHRSAVPPETQSPTYPRLSVCPPAQVEGLEAGLQDALAARAGLEQELAAVQAQLAAAASAAGASEAGLAATIAGLTAELEAATTAREGSARELASVNMRLEIAQQEAASKVLPRSLKTHAARAARCLPFSTCYPSHFPSSPRNPAVPVLQISTLQAQVDSLVFDKSAAFEARVQAETRLAALEAELAGACQELEAAKKTGTPKASACWLWPAWGPEACSVHVGSAGLQMCALDQPSCPAPFCAAGRGRQGGQQGKCPLPFSCPHVLLPVCQPLCICC